MVVTLLSNECEPESHKKKVGEFYEKIYYFGYDPLHSFFSYWL